MLIPSTYHCPHNHSLLSMPLTPCCGRAHFLGTYTSAWGRVLSSLVLCISGLCYCMILLLLGFGVASIPVVFALTTNVSHHVQIYLSISSTLGLIVVLRRLGNCQHQISLQTRPRCTDNWSFFAFGLPASSEPSLWQHACDGHQRRPMFSMAAPYNQGLRICFP